MSFDATIYAIVKSEIDKVLKTVGDSLVLTDPSTNKTYKLHVVDGKLTMSELSDE